MSFGLGDWMSMIGQVMDRLPLTLALLFVSLFFAIVIGIIIAYIRLEKIPILHQLATIYLSFTRSTPLVVQLFLVYFGIPQLLLVFGIDINHWSRFVFVVITFSLHTGAYLSEVFRSSYLAVGKDQLEAAYSVGMTYLQALRRIMIPQAFRVALPNAGNHTIELLKDTALAFTIGMVDMMGQVLFIIGNNYGVGMFEIYVAIAIVYWGICIVIEAVISLIERSLMKKHASISH